jgi:hypothetical protein
MEDFDNSISNVKLYKNGSLTLTTDADTYIDATKKNRTKNY